MFTFDKCIYFFLSLLIVACLNGCYSKRVEKTTIEKPIEHEQIVIKEKEEPKDKVVRRKTTVIYPEY